MLRAIPELPIKLSSGNSLLLRQELLIATGKLSAARAIKRDAIFAAVHLECRLVQKILVLSQLGVERIDALTQAVLIGFLLVDGLSMPGFLGHEVVQAQAHAFGFSVEFARLAGQHLPHDPAHLFANLGIPASLGGLALQRAELLFDFHDDVVDPRQIQFR